MIRATPALLTLILLLIAGSPSYALTIDFEDLDHGQIIYSSQGVDIRTTNIGGGPDLGVAFDSNMTGTADQDLQFYSPGIKGGENGWKSGNLAPGTNLGKIMIIQENLDGCSDTLCSRPDDESSRAAGSIEFDYAGVGSFTSFEMDLIDIQGGYKTEPGSVDFYLGEVHVKEVMFSSFANPQFGYGNNSANRVRFFKGIEFDRVVVRLNGPGAIDNVTTTSAVPEPSAAVLFLIGALAVRAGVRKTA